MSRLDSFIRRLQAQRACLDMAARLITDIDGLVLELGLGNGRTYDHLRETLPGREIYVCERQPAAHPDCTPPPDKLMLGDMRATLAAARPRFEGRVALAHLDAGSGEEADNRALADETLPLLLPLLASGAVLASDPSFDCAELSPIPLPADIAPGRYHLYRRR